MDVMRLCELEIPIMIGPCFSWQQDPMSYAVGNAIEEIKAIATDVIGTNEEDGVAHWLAEIENRNDNGTESKK